MVSNKTNILKRTSLILVAILMLFSTLIFAGCNEVGETGVAIQRNFKVAYGQNDKVSFDYVDEEAKLDTHVKDSTTIPYLVDGVIVCNLYTEEKVNDNKNEVIKRVEVKLDRAYAVYDKYKEDYSQNKEARISIAEFNTANSVKDAKNNEKAYYTMKITIYFPEGYYLKDSNDQPTIHSYEFPVNYRIYHTYEEAVSAEDTIQILSSISNVLDTALTPICAVLCGVGAIFGIFIGINMARANNAEQREEAKKRLIYTLVAIGVGIVLIIIFRLFSSNMITWFGGDDGSTFFTLGK